jgi:uncharacterized radical SAM superfamily Fe-S cluster-containing enzyme
MTNIIRRTLSICPKCGRRIKARIVDAGGAVYLRKICPEHGEFSALIWNKRYSLSEWYGEAEPIEEGKRLNCPSCADGGLCPDHLNDTCCVVYEVTGRCDMACRFCFADAGRGGDVPIEQIKKDFASFVKRGRTLVQLSGGEPALRDDLPEIVKAAVDSGCKYVQLNSNGVRLANEPDFVRRLSEAGLSFVFMQFDGTDDEIYRELRGMPMFDIKRRALENCARYNIGVTLVPTIVPGVNDNSVGDIIRFAVSCSPAVRGVHFQPAAHLGRIPNEPDDSSRCTLDDLIYMTESQTGGMVKAENLQPSKCDHPLCGFHGDFMVQYDRTLYPLTKKRDDAPSCCCGADSPADKNREFVGRRWKREEAEGSCCCSGSSEEIPYSSVSAGSECSSQPQAETSFHCESGGGLGERGDIKDMEYFLYRLKNYGFTITSMAFQDAESLDFERLRYCSLHVFHDGVLSPFCAHYLTPRGG